jgi:hypothetical protein
MLVFPMLAFSQTTQDRPTLDIHLTRLSEQAIQALETSPIPLESVALEPVPLLGKATS